MKMPDARGRQTYQLTASAIVTAQPDAAAPTLIHTTLHCAALQCTLRRGFRAPALTRSLAIASQSFILMHEDDVGIFFYCASRVGMKKSQRHLNGGQ